MIITIQIKTITIITARTKTITIITKTIKTSNNYNGDNVKNQKK